MIETIKAGLRRVAIWVSGTRPKEEVSSALATIAKAGISLTEHKVVLIGRRAYYSLAGSVRKGSNGETLGVNDVDIYDDAMLVVYVKANGSIGYKTFNCTTDAEKSSNPKGAPNLVPGTYMVHTLGTHRGRSEQYPAIVQSKTVGVTCMRNAGNGTQVLDKNVFGINIHRGYITQTGSEGCQTIYPTQWDEFLSTVTDCLKFWHGEEYEDAVIPYILTEK